MEHYRYNTIIVKEEKPVLFQRMLKEMEHMVSKDFQELAKSDTTEYDLTRVYKANWASIWNTPSVVQNGTPLAIIMKNDKFALVMDLTIGKKLLEPKYIYRLEDLSITHIPLIKD